MQANRRKLGIVRCIVPAVMVCLLAGDLTAQLRISPAYVEVKLDKGRPAGRFLVSNIGETTERYRVNAIHFNYTLAGGLKQSATGQHSLAKWIIFNPKELIIAPKTQRAVRFVVVPRAALKEGEYWAAMELESLKQTEKETKDKDGRTLRLKFVATIMVPIFGQVGEIKYKGVVQDVRLTASPNGDMLVGALIANGGNGRLGTAGRYEITDQAGKKVDSGLLGNGYVLRDSKRWFQVKSKAKLPAGRYKVSALYAAEQLAKPIKHEAEIDWKPPKPKPTTKPATTTKPTPATKPAATAATSLRGS